MKINQDIQSITSIAPGFVSAVIAKIAAFPADKFIISPGKIQCPHPPTAVGIAESVPFPTIIAGRRQKQYLVIRLDLFPIRFGRGV